jgi:hypothetical protein
MAKGLALYHSVTIGVIGIGGHIIGPAVSCNLGISHHVARDPMADRGIGSLSLLDGNQKE